MLTHIFFFTLVTGPRRFLGLRLSDTRVYELQIHILKAYSRSRLRCRGGRVRRKMRRRAAFVWPSASTRLRVWALRKSPAPQPAFRMCFNMNNLACTTGGRARRGVRRRRSIQLICNPKLFTLKHIFKAGCYISAGGRARGGGRGGGPPSCGAGGSTGPAGSGFKILGVTVSAGEAAQTLQVRGSGFIIWVSAGDEAHALQVRGSGFIIWVSAGDEAHVLQVQGLGFEG